MPLAGTDENPLNILQQLTADGKPTDIVVGKRPSGVAIDPNGRVWVTNTAEDTIYIVEGTQIIKSLKTGGNPRGIAINATGTVWVANAEDGTVMAFDSSAPGPPLLEKKICLNPFRVAIDPLTMDVWVTCRFDGTVVQLSPKGDILTVTPVGDNPLGLAVAADGTVYIAAKEGVVHVQGLVPGTASGGGMVTK